MIRFIFYANDELKGRKISRAKVSSTKISKYCRPQQIEPAGEEGHLFGLRKHMYTEGIQRKVLSA